jgi:hypothetical protein
MFNKAATRPRHFVTFFIWPFGRFKISRLTKRRRLCWEKTFYSLPLLCPLALSLKLSLFSFIPLPLSPPLSLTHTHTISLSLFTKIYPPFHLHSPKNKKPPQSHHLSLSLSHTHTKKTPFVSRPNKCVNMIFPSFAKFFFSIHIIIKYLLHTFCISIPFVLLMSLLVLVTSHDSFLRLLTWPHACLY